MTTDNNRKKISFSFISIAVASVFLFNANVNIIDFIPDIIGYIIICIALSKLYYLNEDIALSVKFFRYMIVSEVAKVLCFLWLLGLQSYDERNTGTLLFAFTFAVVDALLLFNAFGKLFNGLISLGYAHDNTSVLGSRRARGKSYTEKIKSSTLFFVFFKAAMYTLPEFSNLVAHDYDESSGLVDLYEYIDLMRAMSFVIVTVAGIVWLIKIFRYFVRVNRDEAFKSSLKNTYERDVLPKTGLFVKRDAGTAFFLISAASVLMLDFRFEYFNMIPDFLGAILFLIGIMLCARYLTVKKKLLISASVTYLVASIASYIVEIGFFSKYYYGSVYRDTSAYNYYVLMCITSVIDTIAFGVVVASIIYCLGALIKEHTGFVIGTNASKDLKRIEATQKESQRRLVFLALGGAFVVVTDIFHTFFAIETAYAGAISILGTLVFIISVIKVTQDILDEVKTKYMFE